MRSRVGRDETGVILVQVAVSSLMLMAFLVFVTDYGIVLVSRGQAQNAADGGALAGAFARVLDDTTNPPPAGGIVQLAATEVAEQNLVWGEPGSVGVSYGCPAGVTGGGCVRVDVYRNGELGSQTLPVLFAPLLGITTQGVRATATAQAVVANATNCLKPWIIPDKWEEHYPVNPGVYDPEDSTFDTTTGGKNPMPLMNPDVYRPPTSSDMTGYRASGTPNDVGMLVTLKGDENGTGLTTPGWMYAVRLGGDTGGAAYRDNIEHCSGDTVRIGDRLEIEHGVKNGPTKQGVDALIDADPDAEWHDPDGPGGTPGEVINSCMETASCPAPWSPSPTRSARLIPVALFDPTEVDNKSPADLKVVNILGFFILKMDGKDVQGYFTHYPGLVVSGADDIVDDAAFSRTVMLVR